MIKLSTFQVDPVTAQKMPIYALLHKESGGVCALKCEEGDELLQKQSIEIIEARGLAHVKHEGLLVSETTSGLHGKMHCFENEGRAECIILACRRIAAGGVALDKVMDLEVANDNRFKSVEDELSQNDTKDELDECVDELVAPIVTTAVDDVARKEAIVSWYRRQKYSPE